MFFFNIQCSLEKNPIVLSYVLPTPVTTKHNQIQSFHSVYWLSYCSHNSWLRMKELRINCSSASHLARALLGQLRKSLILFAQNATEKRLKAMQYLYSIRSLVSVLLFILTRWKLSLQSFEGL